MTTTVDHPFRFVSDGVSFAGTPLWDVYSTIDDAHLGIVASATSKRNGTIWMASRSFGERSTGGWRNREAAAQYLLNLHKEEEGQ
jgi:hypothetical protein